MTIKRSLFLVILFLNLMIAYFLVADIYRAWHHQHALVEEQESNIAMTDLLKSANNWAVERGVTNAALAASMPVPDARKQIILKRRAEALAYYKDALKHIKILKAEMDQSSPFYQLVVDATVKMEEKFAKAEQMRARADKALALPKSQRDPSLAKSWVPTMSALIITSQDLRFVLTEEALMLDPELGREAEIRHFAWIMSEYAGRERAILGAHIAANKPLANTTLKTLSEYRGRVEEGWNLAKKLSATSNDVVKQAIKSTQKTFFDDYNGLRDQVYQAGMRAYEQSAVGPTDSSHTIYPVDSKQWIAAATTAINGVLAFQDASIEETTIHMDHMAAEVQREIIIEAVLLLLTLLASGSAFYVLFFKVTRPLKSMTETMNELANGNNDVEIPCMGQMNEMGTMAESVQIFKNNALERARLRDEQQEAEAQSEQEKKQAMNNLADSFEGRVQGIIETVASAATELSSTAEHMTNIIAKSNEMVQESTTNANQASSNVQSVASAAEEMSATTGEIKAQMARANHLVAQSVKVVENADNQAQKLSHASNRVKEVTQLISDISSQINLLALNATIESARAGEAGKGFAVVASEVKNLAAQTDKSIQEIEQVIGDMSAASDDIIDSLGGVKESVENISEASSSVSTSVEQQSAATNEIAANMQSASQGTLEISGNLSEVSSSASQSQASSSQVLSAANELSQQSETLKQEVAKFLCEIRAA